MPELVNHKEAQSIRERAAEQWKLGQVMAFVADARTDIPRLAATVEALWSIVERVAEQVCYYHGNETDLTCRQLPCQARKLLAEMKHKNTT